jgi:hypothetical protein
VFDEWIGNWANIFEMRSKLLVFDEIDDRFAENFRVGIHLVMVHRYIPEIGVGLSKTGNIPAIRAGCSGGL